MHARPEVIELTREQLFERVWSKSAVEVAKELGISGRGLGKRCEKHRIPTPPRGYWARKASVRKARQPKLPVLKDNKARLEILHFSVPCEDSSLGEDIDERIAAESRAENAITVSSELNRPHELVKATKSALGASKPGKYGRLHPHGEDALNMVVGPQSVARALRILDALVKALERRGYAVRVGRKYGKLHSIVDVDGEEIEFDLTEMSRRGERELEATEKDRWKYGLRRSAGLSTTEPVFEPSGQLVLAIQSYSFTSFRRSWRDGKKQRVEDCLNAFVCGLIRVAEDRRQRNREVEETLRVSRDLECQRQVKLDAERAAAQRFDQLTSEADACVNAHRITPKSGQAGSTGRGRTG